MYKVEDCPFTEPTELTPELVERLKIGKDYRDLFRLGLVGIIKHTKESESIPELWWSFNDETGEWDPYGIQLEIDKFQLVDTGGSGEVGPQGPQGEPGPQGEKGDPWYCRG